MIKFEIFLSDENILIYSPTESFSEFYIEIDGFWQFVVRSGYHEYCVDYYNPATSSHEQKTGELSFEEYFNMQYEDIRPDLEAYLKKANLISNQ